jgi:hypothetical protein
MDRSLTVSCLPTFLIAANWMFYGLRIHRPWSRKSALFGNLFGKERQVRPRRVSIEGVYETEFERTTRVRNDHIYFSLVISYLMLPTVAEAEFRGLDCIVVSGNTYLRPDTTIDCSSTAYKRYLGANVFFIILHQTIPLVWFLLLWRDRELLNPKKKVTHFSKLITAEPLDDPRNEMAALQPTHFLWLDYLPEMYWFEILDIYRRLFFVAIVRMVSVDLLTRASVGSLAALLFIGLYRELSPFVRESSNILSTLANYQIFMMFFAALVIESDALGSFGSLKNDQVAKLKFGAVLVAVNVVVLACSLWFVLKRLQKEREMRFWRKVCSDAELEILERVMLNDAADSTRKSLNSNESGFELSSILPPGNRRSSEVEQTLLSQYILRPEDVKLLEKVGAGSFGEVSPFRFI